MQTRAPGASRYSGPALRLTPVARSEDRTGRSRAGSIASHNREVGFMTTFALADERVRDGLRRHRLPALVMTA